VPGLTYDGIQGKYPVNCSTFQRYNNSPLIPINKTTQSINNKQHGKCLFIYVHVPFHPSCMVPLHQKYRPVVKPFPTTISNNSKYWRWHNSYSSHSMSQKMPL